MALSQFDTAVLGGSASWESGRADHDSRRTAAPRPARRRTADTVAIHFVIIQSAEGEDEHDPLKARRARGYVEVPSDQAKTPQGRWDDAGRRRRSRGRETRPRRRRRRDRVPRRRTPTSRTRGATSSRALQRRSQQSGRLKSTPESIPSSVETMEGAMAIDEARLEDVGSGLAPVSPGWFVVNAAEAAWVRNEAFGGRCVFESTPRVLAERPDVEPQFFPSSGSRSRCSSPASRPACTTPSPTRRTSSCSRARACCVIEEQERELRAWDFVHCPGGTRHTFVGTGDAPCVVFMMGAGARTARSSTRARRRRSPTAPASRPRRPSRPRRTRRSRPGDSGAWRRGATFPGPDCLACGRMGCCRSLNPRKRGARRRSRRGQPLR